jgi:hypothetical protein
MPASPTSTKSGAFPKAVASEEATFDKRLWRDERTPDDDHQERRRRIKVLRKHGNKDVRAVAIANRLDACEPGRRCLSGACPECGHLLQRWFVRNSKRFIARYLEKPGTDLVAVSIIPIKSTARTGKLEKISAANCLRRLKYALQQSSIRVAMGGMDFSFNEDAKKKYKPFWCQHYYIIACVRDATEVRKALKKLFPSAAAIPRPVKLSPFENKPRRRSYPLKTTFKQRIGYKTIKTDNSGTKRKCRNTRRDRLRSRERFELFIYLNKIGLASRVIFLGATPISDSSGVYVARRRSRKTQRRIAEQM